jgi:hypothetical protein
MPMVECPSCVAKLDAPAGAEGHTIRCPKCGEVFVLRFPARSDPVIEIHNATAPPPSRPFLRTNLGPRRSRTAEPNSPVLNESRDAPWVILELAAVMKGMHTVVTCRVKNPERAILEIAVVGSQSSDAIESSFGPNDLIPSVKEFTIGRFPVGTPVSATLFDSARRATCRAAAIVEAEPSDRTEASQTF